MPHSLQASFFATTKVPHHSHITSFQTIPGNSTLSATKNAVSLCITSSLTDSRIKLNKPEPELPNCLSTNLQPPACAEASFQPPLVPALQPPSAGRTQRGAVPRPTTPQQLGAAAEFGGAGGLEEVLRPKCQFPPRVFSFSSFGTSNGR